MDAFSFALKPWEAYTERLLPMFRLPYEYLEDIQDGSQYRSTIDYVLNALPIIGTAYQRYKQVPNRMSSLGTFDMLEPSVFGTMAEIPLFDPENRPEAPTKELLNYWYYMYKSQGLKPEYNPFLYYKSDKVNKSKIMYEPYRSDNDDRQATEAQVATWYAYYKNNNLSEIHNPYNFYPQYKRQFNVHKRFNPNKIDPNATAAQVKRWYADYKRQGFPEDQNPYLYYPQFSTRRATQAVQFDPDNAPSEPTKLQMAQWYKAFKDWELPEE